MKTRILLPATVILAIAASYIVSRPTAVDSARAVSEAYIGISLQTTSVPTLDEARPRSSEFIPYGGEFWRSKPVAEPVIRSKGAPLPPGVSVREVMNRVSHAIGRKEPGVVRTVAYRAEFKEDGLHFSSGESTMRFATSSISMGEISQPISQAPWRFEGNTAQREIAPGVIEHMETRREGTSVTWVLKSRPDADADVAIGIGIEGLDFAATSASGSHFADANGVSRVRIGQVTAVDSVGQKTALQTRQTDRGLEIVVPKTLIASASYPLAIDPIISAERGINTPVSGILFATAEEPDLAINSAGNVWLLVYESSDGTDRDVLGVRIANSGLSADVNGINISSGPANERQPCVTASSNGWFVAYVKDEAAGSSIQARIVSEAGGVSIEEAFSVDLGAGDETFANPDAATGGGAFIVVAEVRSPNTNGADLVAFTLNTLVPLPFLGSSVFCNAVEDQVDPVIAQNTAGLLHVVWEDSRTLGTTSTDIFMAELSSGGIATPTNGKPIANTAAAEVNPSISFLDNGSTAALAVWNVADVIRGSKIITGTPGASFVIDAVDTGNANPFVTGDGFQWLVVYVDSDNANDIDVLRGRTVLVNQTVNAEFAILESEELNSECAIASRAPETLAGTSRLVVVESEELDGVVSEEVLISRLIGSDETLGIRAFVSTGDQSAQGEPAIASNGSDWLVTWVDTTKLNPLSGKEAGSDILATRISSGGSIRDPSGIVVSNDDLNQLRPKVDAVGGTWLVVWEDWRNLAKQADVRCARVNSAGTVLDPTGINIATQTASDEKPDVAGNGTRWLVVWEDNRTPANLTDIRRTIVETNGNLSNADQIVANTATDDGEPSVAAAAGNWLIAFTTGDSNALGGQDIKGFRVAADGSGAALAETISGFGNDFSPEVGSNGTNWLVVWTDQSAGVVARLVTSAGAPLPGVTTLDTDLLSDKSITSENGEWRVIMEDDSSRSLELARLSAAGTLLASGIRVSNLRDSDGAIAFNPSAGVSLVVSNVRRGNNGRIEAQFIDFNQTIQFAPPARVQFKRSPISLNARSNSGLPVSFKVVSGPANAVGTTLQLKNLGTVRVEASQAGNDEFFAATNVVRTIKVVDTKKPRLANVKVRTSGEGITLSGVAEDNHIPDKLEIRFKGSSEVVRINLKAGNRGRKSFSVKTDLPEGASSARLVAIDKKGNRSRVKSVTIPEA